MNIRFKTIGLFVGFSLFLLFGSFFSVYAQNTSTEKCPVGSCEDSCKNLYVPSLTNGIYKAWCVTKEEQGGAGGRWEGCLCKAPIKDKIQLNVPIPGLGKGGGTGEYLVGGLASYIQHIFIFFIGASIIVSLCVIIIAGARWIASGGNSSTISKSKERIKGAVIGVLIGIFSYSILYFINPDLVQLELREIYTFPALTNNEGSCAKFTFAPYNSPNIEKIARENSTKHKGWLCGSKELTVQQFNDSGVMGVNNGRIFVGGDLDTKACDGFVCSDPNEGCTASGQCVSVSKASESCATINMGIIANSFDSWFSQQKTLFTALFSSPSNLTSILSEGSKEQIENLKKVLSSDKGKNEYCQLFQFKGATKEFNCVYNTDNKKCASVRYTFLGYEKFPILISTKKQDGTEDLTANPCEIFMNNIVVHSGGTVYRGEVSTSGLWKDFLTKSGTKKKNEFVYDVIGNACNQVRGSNGKTCEMKSTGPGPDGYEYFDCKIK